MMQMYNKIEAMADNARQTGAALEAHFQFLLWLIPTVETFPPSQKFRLGDRIQTTAPDVLESLVDATYPRERKAYLARANRPFRRSLHEPPLPSPLPASPRGDGITVTVHSIILIKCTVTVTSGDVEAERGIESTLQARCRILFAFERKRSGAQIDLWTQPALPPATRENWGAGGL